MEFLWVSMIAILAPVAMFSFLWWLMSQAVVAEVPRLDGAVHPWEREEEERTRTKRMNAILEQEEMRRAA